MSKATNEKAFSAALEVAKKAFSALQRAGDKAASQAKVLGEATVGIFNTASSEDAAMKGCELIAGAAAHAFNRANPRPDTEDTQNDPVYIAWKALFVTKLLNTLRPMNEVIAAKGLAWKVVTPSGKSNVGTATLKAVTEKNVTSAIEKIEKAIAHKSLKGTKVNRDKLIAAINARFALELVAD